MEDCPIEASPTERVAEGLVLSDFDEEVNQTEGSSILGEEVTMIPNDCFAGSTTKAGSSDSTTLSNLSQLQSTKFRPDMKTYKISGCENTSHGLIESLQFTLKSEDNDLENKLMILDPLGSSTADAICKEIELGKHEIVISMEVSFTSYYIEKVSVVLNSG